MKVILCIGNILMGDDGVGIVLGHLLTKKGVNCVIAETDLSIINETIIKYKDIILVDAVDLSMEPGEYIISKIKNSYTLPHDLFIHDVSNITLFGIQIENKNLSIGISNCLKSKLKEYINEIMKLYYSS